MGLQTPFRLGVYPWPGSPIPVISRKPRGNAGPLDPAYPGPAAPPSGTARRSKRRNKGIRGSEAAQQGTGRQRLVREIQTVQ